MYAAKADGFDWVVQAFRDKLLLFIVKSIPRITLLPIKSSTLAMPHISDLLTHVLPCYLVFRPVLRASKPAMKEVLDLGKLIIAQPAQAFAAWHAFRKIVQERLATKSDFDAAIK